MSGIQRIALVGVSGAGKSTVARLLAERLGWAFADTDAEIEGRFGQSIPEIFRDHGESPFRGAERELLMAALGRHHIVIATGGGAVVADDVWGPEGLGRPDTLVVALEVRPEVALRRLRQQHADEGASVERPLLAGADPLSRLSSLKASRQRMYDRAGISLIVDSVTPDTVAAEIASLIPSPDQPAHFGISLQAPSGASTIHISPGSLAWLGELTRARWPGARRAWLISDDRVGPLHMPAANAALQAAEFTVASQLVPSGEGSKSLATTARLLDWLLHGGIERGDVVVALGGGVVGDLAGFVAAICLRGVPLVQVPTSLLAMVDSSVGGKTGVNHPTGKNLIGAFYQPPLVVIDPSLLRTLPPRELTSGWAEIVKHGVIQPSTPGGERGDLVTFLERNTNRLAALNEPALTYLIRRNVALKAAVVEADEREAGIRAYLNFGHTLGHAIEAAGYRYLHGEAIAVGMRAAARLGITKGTFDAESASRLDGLIDRFGLPTAAEANPDRVMQLIGSDKKKAAGKLRWVLPLSAGGVTIRDDIPESAVRAALSTVLAAP